LFVQKKPIVDGLKTGDGPLGYLIPSSKPSCVTQTIGARFLKNSKAPKNTFWLIIHGHRCWAAVGSEYKPRLK